MNWLKEEKIKRTRARVSKVNLEKSEIWIGYKIVDRTGRITQQSAVPMTKGYTQRLYDDYGGYVEITR